MNTRLFLLLILILLQIGCNTGDPFYTSYAREDIWRVPLIKPYELLNLKGANPKVEMAYGWELDFNKKNEFGGNHFIRVYRINIKNSYIYGYGKGVYNDFFVIDSKNQKEHFFENSTQWEYFLREISIDTSTVMSTWDLFYDFKDTGKLPWSVPPDK